MYLAGHKKSIRNNKILYGVISVGIALATSLFILNFFFQVIKTPKIQGLPILVSPAVSLIGLLLGTVGYRKNKNFLALVGIIFNIITLIFPFAFWFIGTILFGP